MTTLTFKTSESSGSHVGEIFTLNNKVNDVIEKIVYRYITYKKGTDKKEAADFLAVKGQLKALSERRSALVLDLIAKRLGKQTKDLVSTPPNYRYEIDSFNSSIHPFGEIIEAAIKAAYGLTAGEKPEVSIDARTWRFTQAFEIALSPERINIMPEDMSLQLKALAECIVERNTEPGLFGKIFKIKDEAAEKDLKEIIDGLKKAVLYGHREFGSDAMITPCSFRIDLAQGGSDRVSGSSKKTAYEKEESDAKSIANAMEDRLNARLKNFGWTGWAGQKLVKVSVIKRSDDELK